MKQDVLSSINAASMFSVNTSLNTVQNQHNNNHLHSFYQQLFPDSKTYPFLSKLLFLHFILRENVLIYSSHRAEIKEVWMQLGKQLATVLPVFIIDSQSKMEQILKIMGEKKRALIFDLSSISNQGLNYLLNNPLVDMSWIVVQSKDKPLRPELSDLFPLIFQDDEQEKQGDLFGQKTAPTKKAVEKFNKDKFNDVVAVNFSQTLESKEEEGFLKTYLQLLREKITAQGIAVPLSRWKKMIQILHFIGLTKQEGTFRRLSLTDCLLTPSCLGRTYVQLQAICRCNEETILEIIPHFGTSKWSKQLATHFWVQSKQKQYFLSLTDKLKGKVSFFYPCSKFPEAVRLLNDSGSVHYRVIGHDKKLMSDKYLQIDEAKKYQLTLKYRSNHPVVVHIGVACYDQNKDIINPVQICRYEETAVRLEKLEENKLVVVEEDRHILAKWKTPNSFAYERCIGVYRDGDLNQIVSLSEVMYADSDSYSQQPSAGIYFNIAGDGIELNQIGLKMFRQLQNSLAPGSTKLVNHYEGGTYAINQTQTGVQSQWKTIKAQYHGLQRSNSGHEFLLGTKSVRIVVMCNYNSGYPNFKIECPTAEVDFKQVEWQEGE